MGGLPLPRKNPFMAQGLVPGITLRLDVSAGKEGETHTTRVEDVSESHITILVPMRGLRPRPFGAGTLVHAQYFYQQKRWMFVTEVAGHSADGMFEYLRLAMLNNGVDLKGWRGGLVSSAHSAEDVEWTVDAWRKSLRALRDEGELPAKSGAKTAAAA